MISAPADIITSDAIFNAFTVDMALGGSSNSVLHLMAIASEAGIDFNLATVNEISQRTPYLCSLRPVRPAPYRRPGQGGGHTRGHGRAERPIKTEIEDRHRQNDWRKYRRREEP